MIRTSCVLRRKSFFLKQLCRYKNLNFEARFSPDMFKCIVEAKKLNDSLIISFDVNHDECVHFLYELDKLEPQSHYSVFLTSPGSSSIQDD